MTITVKVKFKSAFDEEIMIAGAISQGCDVRHCGGGYWLIYDLPRSDYMELNRVARYISIVS